MSYERFIPVQERADVAIKNFVLRGKPKVDHTAILLQDGGRSGDIVTYTLMSKIAGSQKWGTFINEAATDGTAIPQAIYLGPVIAEADIVAGDISGLIILVRDAEFREDMLIIENAKTLETVITIGTKDLRTVRDYLLNLNLIAREVKSRTRFENS